MALTFVDVEVSKGILANRYRAIQSYGVPLHSCHLVTKLSKKHWENYDMTTHDPG